MHNQNLYIVHGTGIRTASMVKATFRMYTPNNSLIAQIIAVINLFIQHNIHIIVHLRNVVAIKSSLRMRGELMMTFALYLLVVLG